MKQFRRSGEKEAIVTLPSRNAPSLTMTVRLLKIEREGKSMVVATSLLDATLFPLEFFSELYHMRWWNEEWYKELGRRSGSRVRLGSHRRSLSARTPCPHPHAEPHLAF
ncbi:MAG: hypothetical protein ACYDBP_15560, partial [Leptospirales bacterium]